MKNSILSCLIITLSLSAFYGVPVAALEPDWTEYNLLLKEHLKPDNKQNIQLTAVNYSKLSTDPRLKKIKKQIADFKTSKLDSDSERIAFYINAYNILALSTVASHWPVKSIKDIGRWYHPVWKHKVGFIDGKKVSLDYIEHTVLRSMDEPRIHFAVNCASLSCPDLHNEAFTANKLDEQLDLLTKKFLNDETKGIKIKNNKIHISEILKWYESDFDQYGGIENFIKEYRSDIEDNFSINGFLKYNWSVNGE